MSRRNRWRIIQRQHQPGSALPVHLGAADELKKDQEKINAKRGERRLKIS
jgi:hypothetical protein